MKPQAQETSTPRSIDVTGLPESAVWAIELLVSQLRSQKPARLGGTTHFSSYEEWSKAFHEWAESHQPLGISANYDRESIYSDRV
ncbi:MAG: hypothetical protein JO112_15880 [Planctomycetes bacterium]|nr:hypothetical protein [Planctomycetota bacterium]